MFRHYLGTDVKKSLCELSVTFFCFAKDLVLPQGCRRWWHGTHGRIQNIQQLLGQPAESATEDPGLATWPSFCQDNRHATISAPDFTSECLRKMIIWIPGAPSSVFLELHMHDICGESSGVHGTLAILMICLEDQRQNLFNWRLAADWGWMYRRHILYRIKEWVVVQHHRSSKCRLEKGDWLVVWKFGTWILWLSLYWECHHPHWRSLIFFRGLGLNHQPGEMGATSCPRVLWIGTSRTQQLRRCVLVRPAWSHFSVGPSIEAEPDWADGR